jgi:hypothetical protein
MGAQCARLRKSAPSAPTSRAAEDVSGEELLTYLRDFLGEHYRGCTIEAAEEPGLYRLKVLEELRELVKRSVPVEDLGRRLFLARSMSGQVLLTTDQEYAESHREVEFLTFYHPLVRAVKAHYEQNTAGLHPVAFVGLKSVRVKPGRYVWFLFETTITGARPERELDLIVFPEASRDPLPVEESQDLLTELIAGAEAIPSGRRQVEIDPEVGTVAQETAATRLEQRKIMRSRVNDALVERRLASLRESLERNRRIQEQRLATARERGRKESYLRGIESRIRNLESTYERRRQEIERGRNLGEELDLRGAGGLEVKRPATRKG